MIKQMNKIATDLWTDVNIMVVEFPEHGRPLQKCPHFGILMYLYV